MPETKTAKKQTKKTLEKLAGAACPKNALFIGEHEMPEAAQALKDAGFTVAKSHKAPTLAQLRSAQTGLVVTNASMLVERVIGKLAHSLLDNIEPRNKFLDRYFEITQQLFDFPVVGLALFSTSRPWVTFTVQNGVSKRALDHLIDELSSGLMLANNLSIDLRGEPKESGGKNLESHKIIHIKQDKSPIGALIFAFHEEAAQDELTEHAMEQLAEHILPVMRLILANQELESLYQREQYRSSTDPLTGLYNLEFLVGFLQQQLLFSYRQRSPVGLVMIDIDHLKSINDEFGYEMGDLVLSSIANRLLGMTRSSDLIARYGGGSFAIVMPNTDLNGARVVAEKTRLEIQQMNFVRGTDRKGPHVTVSVGCACFNMEDLNPETILRDSKLALGRAKQHGGNKVEV